MAAPFRRACLRRVEILNRGCSSCNSLRVLITATRNGSQKKQEDFFGIAEDQRLANAAEPMLPSSTTREKEIRKLLRPLRKKQENSEVIVQATFGQVRLDSHAKNAYIEDLNPRSIMKTVTEASRTSLDTDEGSATVDVTSVRQNLKTKTHDGTRHQIKSRTHPQPVTDNIVNKDENKRMSSGRFAAGQQETNYFDEQYFGPQLQAQSSEHHTQVCRTGDGAREVSQEQRGNPVQGGTSSSRSASDLDTDCSCVADSVNQNGSKPKDNFIDQMYFPTLAHPPGSSEVHSPMIDSDSHGRGSIIDQQYFIHRADSRRHPSTGNCNTTSTTSTNAHENIVEVHSDSEEQKFHQNHSIPQDSHYDNDNHGKTSFQFAQSQIDLRTEKSTNRAAFEQIEEVSFVDAQYFDGHVSGQSTSPFDSVVKQYGIADNEAVAGLQVKQLEKDNEITATTSSQLGMQEETYAESSKDHSHSHESQSHLSESEQRDLESAKESVLIPGTASDYNGEVPAKMSVHKKQQERSRKQVNSQGRKNVDQDTKSESKTTNSDPDSAYNVAKKMRKNLRFSLADDAAAKELPKDKQRLLSIRERLPDLEHMPAAEVAQLLADNIIFENDDFIAVDKPYGLPSHGGPSVRVSVGQVLQQLSGHVDRGRHQIDSLHLIHRLDKETTGVMLLAKNAEVAWRLLGMFRRREVGKTYWTVTKGLPKPLEGVIDIPLMRQKVGKIYKTVVRPEQYLAGDQVKTQTWSRRDDRSQEAVTQYQVLAHRDSMALVECRPLTGVQHQIRTHLAQVLNAPVLGDHKYSHLDRLAPQKLFPEALQKLGIRQAQVRHLPMHLHAKALLLPEWRGHTNIFIKASVPRFFLHSLKALKIKIPSK